MLGLFRSHFALNHLLLLGYVFIIRFHEFFEKGITTEKSGSWHFQMISEMVSHPVFVNVITILLIWIQAVLLNNMVNNHKLSRENSVLPGLWYALLISLIPQSGSLSPLIFANTFLVIGFVNLVESTKQVDIRHFLFNAGLFFTLSAVFYPPYVLMLLAGLLGFYIFKSLKIRGNLQFITGILSAMIILFGIQYVGTGHVESHYQLHFINFAIIFQLPDISVLVFAGLYVTALLFVLFYYPSLIFKKNVQTRKKIELAYVVAMFTALITIFSFQNHVSQLAMLAFPVGTLVGIQTAESKSYIVSEMLHLFFLSGLIFIHFIS